MCDIYIAQTIIDNNRTMFYDSARKADLLNTVLQKNKVNKAVFDSSLVWYSDNLEKYIKVNERVMRRYDRMTETLKTEQAENAKNKLPEEPEPAVRYPVKDKAFFLKKTDLPQNVYLFRADTVFQEYGGTYNLRFNVMGLPTEIRPAVTFYLQGPDTTIVRGDSIRGNGFFTLTVGVFPARKIDQLYGSIHFPETSTDMTLFINRFGISKK